MYVKSLNSKNFCLNLINFEHFFLQLCVGAHAAVTVKLDALDSKKKIHYITHFRYLISGPALVQLYDPTDKQSVFSWSICWKKSYYPFYLLSHLQLEGMQDLNIDSALMNPLIQEAFRRSSLRRIQLEEQEKIGLGTLRSGDRIVTDQISSNSLNRCRKELMKLEKNLNELQRRKLKLVFDKCIVRQPCNCGRPDC